MLTFNLAAKLNIYLILSQANEGPKLSLVRPRNNDYML